MCAGRQLRVIYQATKPSEDPQVSKNTLNMKWDDLAGFGFERSKRCISSVTTICVCLPFWTPIGLNSPSHLVGTRTVWKSTASTIRLGPGSASVEWAQHILQGQYRSLKILLIYWNRSHKQPQDEIGLSVSECYESMAQSVIMDRRVRMLRHALLTIRTG